MLTEIIQWLSNNQDHDPWVYKTTTTTTTTKTRQL